MTIGDYQNNSTYTLLIVIVVSIVFFIMQVVKFIKLYGENKENKSFREETRSEIKLIREELKAHQKWHEEKEKEGKKVYKTLSPIYDIQIANYNIKGSFLDFINEKFISIHSLTEYLYNLNYLDVNFNILNTKMNGIRDCIFLSAKRYFDVDFARLNKKYNNEAFQKSRTDIQVILSDKERNDKQNRILEVMKKTVSDTIRYSVEAYEEYLNEQNPSPEFSEKKFYKYVQNSKLLDAALELKKTGKEKDFITEILAAITEHDLNVVKKFDKPEDRAKIVKLILYTYDRIKKT